MKYAVLRDETKFIHVIYFQNGTLPESPKLWSKVIECK